MKRHWLTTLFGILLSSGIGLGHFTADDPQSTAARIAAAVQVVGTLGLGLSAADARKTTQRKQER